MLAPNLDIAGNIFLGNERGRWPARRPAAAARAMHAQAAALLARVGLHAAARHAGLAR